MTGTPFNDDLADVELMLRDRFESAVGGMTPDSGRLIADGALAGRGAVRRRRVLAGVAAAAVAAIAVGSISYATQGDLLGLKDDHATDNGQLIELVPATARGMAAAVMSHTKDLGTLMAVGGIEAPDGKPSRDFGWPLAAQIAYDLGNHTGVEIDVYATPDRSIFQGCDHTPEGGAVTLCREFTLPDGSQAVYVEYGLGNAGSGTSDVLAAAVVAERDADSVAVMESLHGSSRLVLDQDALAAIAADPAIGMSTTGAFNAAGEDIADFKDGGLISGESSSGSGSATAPPPETASAQPR